MFDTARILVVADEDMQSPCIRNRLRLRLGQLAEVDLHDVAKQFAIITGRPVDRFWQVGHPADTRISVKRQCFLK